MRKRFSHEFMAKVALESIQVYPIIFTVGVHLRLSVYVWNIHGVFYHITTSVLEEKNIF